MCRRFKANITEFLFPQDSELSIWENVVASITSKTRVMPELATERVTRPSDDLGTFVTFVEVCFDVTGLAEEFVVQLDPDLTHGTLETLLVPGQSLATVTVHLYTAFSLDLEATFVTSG